MVYRLVLVTKGTIGRIKFPCSVGPIPTAICTVLIDSKFCNHTSQYWGLGMFYIILTVVLVGYTKPNNLTLLFIVTIINVLAIFLYVHTFQSVLDMPFNPCTGLAQWI